MHPSLIFIRIFFTTLSIFFMTLYMISRPTGSLLINSLIGIGLGVGLMALLIGFDRLFRRFNLRIFNIVIIGLFIGYFMGQGIVLVFDAVLDLSSIPKFLTAQVLETIKLVLFLFGTYLGAIMTLRAADQLYISIPFVKFAPTAEKKRDLLIDMSALNDPRLFDFCSTGILNHSLIMPRFIIKELYAQAETGTSATKVSARQTLEVVKKMEELPKLNLRFNDTDFPEVMDLPNKQNRLARFLNATILISDSKQSRMKITEGVQTINLHTLSNALKPLTEMGETLEIKVQRYGKEPRQGVGYLEDGTMVVINGGGDYIGETVGAQVLSIKHTSSGRMIFCNVIEENSRGQEHGDYQPKQGNQQVYYQQEEENENDLP